MRTRDKACTGSHISKCCLLPDRVKNIVTDVLGENWRGGVVCLLDKQIVKLAVHLNQSCRVGSKTIDSESDFLIYKVIDFESG